MAASRYDFTIEQGSSFKLSLIYKDVDGNVVDLTDWCARLYLVANNGSTYTFSSDNLDVSVYKFNIDGPAGKLTLMIPSSTTNSFGFFVGKYDLEIQSPDDLYAGGGKYTIRLLYGQIDIVKRYSLSNTGLECQNE